MKTKPILARLDQLLIPIGFSRTKMTWRRAVGRLVDIIDLQISKSKDGLTVNAGTLDLDVHALCWGAPPKEAEIEEPLCTVRARIGELIDGKDRWWSEGGDVADEIAAQVQEKVIPFLDGVHVPRVMIEWLEGGGVTKQKYPPPIIYLALLKNKAGDAAACRSILNELQAKTAEAWQTRIQEVLKRLEKS